MHIFLEQLPCSLHEGRLNNRVLHRSGICALHAASDDRGERGGRHCPMTEVRARELKGSMSFPPLLHLSLSPTLEPDVKDQKIQSNCIYRENQTMYIKGKTRFSKDLSKS